MTNPTCGTCKHWERMPPDPNDLLKIQGACWGAPPTAHPIQDRTGRIAGAINMRPVMQKGERACGQYEPGLEIAGV